MQGSLSSSSVTVATLEDATQCVELIERLTTSFRTTFKRNPQVGLSVSVTFAEGATTRRRTKNWAAPIARDTYAVTARMGDPSSADQQWETRWFIAAAKVVDQPAA